LIELKANQKANIKRQQAKGRKMTIYFDRLKKKKSAALLPFDICLLPFDL